MKRKPKVPTAAKKAATVHKPAERTPSALEPVTAQAEVRISRAKGRPMLTWVGKRPLERVTAFPAQLVETFNPTGEKGASQNLLFHGDNKEVLAYLLANGFRGKIDLIYIDPPFDSGADYVRKVQLRGITGAAKIEGETYTLGEQIQYADIWANDNYLQFMYERLLLMKELLADDGALFLHCDWHKSHHLRCLVDEVFSPENFRNEIVWFYPGREMHIENKFNAKHDTILFVARSDATKVNMAEVAIEYDKSSRLKGLRRKIHKDDDGREWVWETRAQAAGQKPYKRYVEEILSEGRALNDVWDDIQFLRGNDPSRTGLPTQKPEELLERILLALSAPGETVLDCFIGSGTAAAVAQKIGRLWIGCDVNKGAIQTTARRLQTIIHEQIEMRSAESRTAPTLPGIDLAKEEEPTQPASLAFSVYRVNDYDLQIQHNEAVNLACEHIGIERTRADAFFDGTLGKRLVKITPFNHPLSPLDLEEIKKELKSRPEEDRDIVVVALGKEHAIDVWLEEWNRLRKQGRVPNRIDVVELRTDEKYGKFFVHKPARAEVRFARQKDKIVVDIQDFLSPTIIERLTAQEGVLKPQITDWRSMVDSVMIDSAYDGKVFNIVLSDVPEKKSDLVQGRYELPAPKGPTTVAVKVTDMLGEEVLVLREV